MWEERLRIYGTLGLSNNFLFFVGIKLKKNKYNWCFKVTSKYTLITVKNFPAKKKKTVWNLKHIQKF